MYVVKCVHMYICMYVCISECLSVCMYVQVYVCACSVSTHTLSTQTGALTDLCGELLPVLGDESAVYLVGRSVPLGARCDGVVHGGVWNHAVSALGWWSPRVVRVDLHTQGTLQRLQINNQRVSRWLGPVETHCLVYNLSRPPSYNMRVFLNNQLLH